MLSDEGITSDHLHLFVRRVRRHPNNDYAHSQRTHTVKRILDFFATIAAITIPLLVVIHLLGLGATVAASPMLTSALNALKVMSVVGILWILICLWQSDETTDNKQYYTIISFFFVGLPLAFYWFSKGLKNPPTKNTSDKNSA